MNEIWKKPLFILCGLAVMVIVTLIYGQRRWQSAREVMLKKMDAAQAAVNVRTYHPEVLDKLPAPVQRYFHKVLKTGQPIITAVRLEQEGTFNIDIDNDKWNSFTANQQIVIQQPGFVWDARIELLPSLSVRVHDAYVIGEGFLNVSLFGLITIVKMQGTPSIAEGQFMRFLAEAPCYPTALLPTQGVQWTAVDDTAARATLQDGEITATLLFHFDDNDLIETIYAEARGRTVGDTIILTPWEGQWRNYQSRNGMLIPLEGEVSWITSDGPKPYWRGRITTIHPEFADDTEGHSAEIIQDSEPSNFPPHP